MTIEKKFTHPNSENFLNSAKQFCKEGKLEEAIKQLEELIKEESENAYAYVECSKVYLQIAGNRNLLSLKEFFIAEQIAAHRDEGYYPRPGYIGIDDFTIYKTYKDLLHFIYEKSISRLEKAIEIDGNYAYAYALLGKCYLKIQNFDSSFQRDVDLREKAKDFLNKAIRIDLNCAYAYVVLGYYYLIKENYKESIQNLNKAIEIDSNCADAYYWRAFFYFQRICRWKNLENPVFKFAHRNFLSGDIIYDSEYSVDIDYRNVLADSNKAIEINSEYAETYCQRGLYYLEKSNYKKSISDLNKAIELDSNNINNYDALRHYYLLKHEKNRLSQDEKNSLFECFDNIIDIEKEPYRKMENGLSAINLSTTIKEYDVAKSFVEKVFNTSNPYGQEFKCFHLENIKNVEDKDTLNKELEEKNKHIEETNKALGEKTKQNESLQNRMQKLVEQFTHSLGNVIFPDTIYQVAERLKNRPECRRDTLLLHEAYHAEIIIKLQAELLRQRYSNTNPEKFRLMIRNCRRNANAGDKTKTIEAVLNYAVSRVTARFLNQHYAGLETIRNKILTQTNTDLNQLKQKFEDDILLHNCLSPLEWVSQNLRPIQITQISPLWKKVFILSDSYAEALLFGYFSEILFNAFKYADHESQEFLTLSFAEQTINEDIYLSCNWSNPTTNQKLSGLGTNQGLEAIAEDLKQLNNTEKPEQSLLICQQDNQFQVTLFFKKHLLIDDSPILTRQRKNREVSHA